MMTTDVKEINQRQAYEEFNKAEFGMHTVY